MTTDTKWTSRMVSFWVECRGRFLFYSFVSALVGVGLDSLISFAQDSYPNWQGALGGAVIGVCIMTVIFSFDFLIVARRGESSSPSPTRATRPIGGAASWPTPGSRIRTCFPRTVANRPSRSRESVCRWRRDAEPATRAYPSSWCREIGW